MKFHPLVTYLWLRTEKSLKFRQSKGNISAITDDTPIKLHMHNLTIVIYIQYKFHWIPSIGYLVKAEDGKTDWWRNQKDRRTTPNQYPCKEQYLGRSKLFKCTYKCSGFSRLRHHFVFMMNGALGHRCKSHDTCPDIPVWLKNWSFQSLLLGLKNGTHRQAAGQVNIF